MRAASVCEASGYQPAPAPYTSLRAEDGLQGRWAVAVREGLLESVELRAVLALSMLAEESSTTRRTRNLASSRACLGSERGLHGCETRHRRESPDPRHRRKRSMEKLLHCLVCIVFEMRALHTLHREAVKTSYDRHNQMSKFGLTHAAKAVVCAMWMLQV